MVADLFHYGHVNFLRKASSHGDFLLVGVHADEVVMTYKRRPILSMEERVASVEGCRYADEVIPNAPLEIDRNFIEKHNIDLVMHGDDFSNDLEKLCYKIPMEMGIYRTVGYTEGISTTDLINRVKTADTKYKGATKMKPHLDRLWPINTLITKSARWLPPAVTRYVYLNQAFYLIFMELNRC